MLDQTPFIKTECNWQKKAF